MEKNSDSPITLTKWFTDLKGELAKLEVGAFADSEPWQSLQTLTSDGKKVETSSLWELKSLGPSMGETQKKIGAPVSATNPVCLPEIDSPESYFFAQAYCNALAQFDSVSSSGMVGKGIDSAKEKVAEAVTVLKGKIDTYYESNQENVDEREETIKPSMSQLEKKIIELTSKALQSEADATIKDDLSSISTGLSEIIEQLENLKTLKETLEKPEVQSERTWEDYFSGGIVDDVSEVIFGKAEEKQKTQEPEVPSERTWEEYFTGGIAEDVSDFMFGEADENKLKELQTEPDEQDKGTTEETGIAGISEENIAAVSVKDIEELTERVKLLDEIIQTASKKIEKVSQTEETTKVGRMAEFVFGKLNNFFTKHKSLERFICGNVQSLQDAKALKKEMIERVTSLDSKEDFSSLKKQLQQMKGASAEDETSEHTSEDSSSFKPSQ